MSFRLSNFIRRAGILGLPLAITLFIGCNTEVNYAPPANEGPSDPVYLNQVRPVLANNCFRCHGGMNHKGGLTLDSKAGIRRGGNSGRTVVPGHPEQSFLVKLIRHEGPANDPRPMPPKKKLSDADIALIEKWISDGAIMDLQPTPAPTPPAPTAK